MRPGQEVPYPIQKVGVGKAPSLFEERAVVCRVESCVPIGAVRRYTSVYGPILSRDPGAPGDSRRRKKQDVQELSEIHLVDVFHSKFAEMLRQSHTSALENIRMPLNMGGYKHKTTEASD
jgi:hypothetical protein